MKRLLEACFAAFAAAIIACGGDDGTSSANPPPGGTTTPTDPRASYLGTWSGNGLYTWQAAGFTAEPLVVPTANYTIDRGSQSPSRIVFLLSPCNVNLEVQGTFANIVQSTCRITIPERGWTYDVTYTGGTATLSGTALNVNASGNFSFHDNTGFYPDVTGSFFLTANFNKV